MVCAITPFGLTGPYRSWRATHLTSCALGGGMYQYGSPKGRLLALPGRQLYDHAGTHAAIAVLAALRARPAVGGQFIDLSAHEVMGSSLYELHRYTNFQDIMRRRGSYAAVGGMLALPGWPGRVHRLDGEAVGRLRPGLLGSPPELSDPAFADPAVRQQRAEEIMAVVGPAILAMSREEFVGRGQQLSVPCSLVNTVGQFAQDPQLRSRGFFVRQPLAGLVELRCAGPAVPV